MGKKNKERKRNKELLYHVPLSKINLIQTIDPILKDKITKVLKGKYLHSVSTLYVFNIYKYLLPSPKSNRLVDEEKKNAFPSCSKPKASNPEVGRYRHVLLKLSNKKNEIT